MRIERWSCALAGVGLTAGLGLGQAAPAKTPGPSEVALSGELEVLIEDDFARGRSRRHHFLVDANGQRTPLHFQKPSPGWRSGQAVTLRGRAHAGGIDVEVLQLDASADSSSDPAQPSGLALPALDPAEEQRAAVVLMVDLVDARASDRYTLETLADAMFTGARSVDELFREGSYFQTSLPGDGDGDGWADVFGPFAIDYAASCYGYNDWAAAVDAAATTAGIDLSRYRHRVYVVPHYSDLGCSWMGLATLGCPGSGCRAWIANAGSPTVFAHELGHNFIFNHASTDLDDDGVVDAEYGDRSDPVASSGTWRSFNAPHRVQAGWFDAWPGAVSSPEGGGAYTLHSLDLDPADAPGPQVLTVPRPQGGDYHLSLRRPSGYDEDLSSYYTQGVSLHHFSGEGRTHLIDVLAVGEVFSDASGRLRITPLAVSADGSQAQVELALDCGEASPEIQVVPGEQAAALGSEAWFAVEVGSRELAGCPVANYTLSASYPAGLSGELSPAELALAPGESGSVSLRVSVSADPGNGSFEIRDVRHPDGVPGVGRLIVDTTPPSTPELSARVKRKTQVLLSWSPSSDGDGSGVSHYVVRRQDSAGPDTELEVQGEGVKDTQTLSGHTYTYTVSAVDLAGNASTPSSAVVVDLGGGGGDGGDGSDDGSGGPGNGRGRGRNK